MRESGGDLYARIHNGGISFLASPRAIGPARGIDPTRGVDAARIVAAAKEAYLMGIVRSILPQAGELLPAKEKIHRCLGDIMQRGPEADAVVPIAP
jgi:hypothetical protein